METIKIKGFKNFNQIFINIYKKIIRENTLIAWLRNHNMV